MKKLFLLLVVVSLLGMGSCSKKSDTDVCSTNWTVALANQSNSLYTTALAYASSPTPTTCNAYKTAINSYISALEPYKNCTTMTGADKTAFDNALTSTKASLQLLTCQ